MYSEDEAIKYIRGHIPAEVSQLYDDDELLNVIDMIYDYYEQNGLLEVDDDEDDPPADELLSELTDYATRMLRRDKEAQMRPEHLGVIIEAELAYENTLV